MQETLNNTRSQQPPAKTQIKETEPLNLDTLNVGEGKKKPFDDSVFDGVIDPFDSWSAYGDWTR